jgi:hypothetical protein
MSGSMANVPYTAAPGGNFGVPRIASTAQYHPSFLEEDEDEIHDMLSQNHYNNAGADRPMTAAVDGARFSHQQTRMNANTPPFVPSFANTIQTPSSQAQVQAMQEMQMLQLEVMRLQVSYITQFTKCTSKPLVKQSVQAQQFQAGVQANYLAELVRQQMSQTAQGRHASNAPATAGPFNSSFDLRSATLSAQNRRANQAEMLKAQLGVGGDSQVPMSAALGGKFGSRSLSSVPSSNRFAADGGEQTPPPTPGHTTVISGGTPLGSPLSNGSGNNTNASSTPSKSDSVTSWRRGGNNNSVLSGNRAVTISSSPTVKITPPPPERVSPPPGLNTGKARPLPLSFSVAASQPMPRVAIDTSIDGGEAIEVELPQSSNSSSRSGSSLSPTTPPSSAYNDMPLSPREEAAKKLYEGLGIGRPAPGAVPQAPLVVSHRMASQPMRQPRGPPSGADELGPKNFATRIRRKAIGGLGVLMGARERREAVEVY